MRLFLWFVNMFIFVMNTVSWRLHLNGPVFIYSLAHKCELHPIDQISSEADSLCLPSAFN